MGKTNEHSTRVVKWTYLTFMILIGIWIVAWVLKRQLDRVTGSGTSTGSFIYWTSAKLVIWILPAWWLIRLSGRRLKQVFNISNYQLMMKLIEHCRKHETIEEILSLPDVKERVDLYFEHQIKFREQIERCSTIHGNLVRRK